MAIGLLRADFGPVAYGVGTRRKPMYRLLPALGLFILALTAHAGEEDHKHQHGPVDLGKLGKVKFETTCRAGEEFSRAVAMVHSFWYPEAEKAFAKIAAADPQCAMAHWG